MPSPARRCRRSIRKRRIDRSSGAELKYQLTVPNGEYEVRLHFAEVWSGAYATGIRVFDVSLEGALTFNDLDIFAEVGANKALVKTAQTTVSDGKLTIDFQRVVQNPNLSGIEVYPVLGSGAVETEPPSIPGNPCRLHRDRQQRGALVDRLHRQCRRPGL